MKSWRIEVKLASFSFHCGEVGAYLVDGARDRLGQPVRLRGADPALAGDEWRGHQRGHQYPVG